ncbi:30S ribosomal protein S5, partial [archaeon]|nr:30S ribosomal protein S5 [archaeon]
FDLAGVKDVWAFTKGDSRTTLNFILAAIHALENTAKMRVSDDIARKLER